MSSNYKFLMNTARTEQTKQCVLFFVGWGCGGWGVQREAVATIPNDVWLAILPLWLCEHWVIESTRKNRSTLRWRLGSLSNFRMRSSTTCNKKEISLFGIEPKYVIMHIYIYHQMVSMINLYMKRPLLGLWSLILGKLNTNNLFCKDLIMYCPHQFAWSKDGLKGPIVLHYQCAWCQWHTLFDALGSTGCVLTRQRSYLN